MSGYTIGIDVGGTKVLGVAVDPRDPREPLAQVQVSTPRGVERLGAVLLLVVADLRRRVERHLEGVGVGMAGFVDRAGVLRVAPNLPGDERFDAAARLAPQVGVPVVVDNDANCALWAEVRDGAARGFDEVAYVAVGTGIGGALVINGQLVRGAHGFAGEPGHMILVPGGWPCACGRLGCWEAYASGTALGRMARDAVAEGRARAVLDAAGGRLDAVRGEHVTEALRAGDRDASAIMDRFAHWVAMGLSNVVNLLDPELVVLGGSIVEVGDALLTPVRAAFAEVSLGGTERPDLAIVGAAFGARAAATGAALQVAGTAGNAQERVALRR